MERIGENINNKDVNNISDAGCNEHRGKQMQRCARTRRLQQINWHNAAALFLLIYAPHHHHLHHHHVRSTYVCMYVYMQHTQMPPVKLVAPLFVSLLGWSAGLLTSIGLAALLELPRLLACCLLNALAGNAAYFRNEKQHGSTYSTQHKIKRQKQLSKTKLNRICKYVHRRHLKMQI